MSEDTLIPIGKIVGTHGIKGNLRVISFAESTATFAPGRQLALRRKGEPVAPCTIASASPHKRGILLALEGIASIDAAKELIGSELCIDKTTLPELETSTYYWHQIIGMDVVTINGRYLGRVEAVWPTGSNDVYIVREGDKEILIPAIDSVVIEIDLEKEVIQVDLPEGLEA
ncbi:MAG: 16S rRNA processing protein RimM [Deltaproteobacteria bacterium]|nr:16S rRNA processing protein RimM [Deltaproteobacteria bacterium]